MFLQNVIADKMIAILSEAKNPVHSHSGVILERSDRIHMRHPERSVTESKDLGLNL